LRCGNGDLRNFADPVAAMTWLDRAREISQQHLARHPKQGNESFTPSHALDHSICLHQVTVVPIGGSKVLHLAHQQDTFFWVPGMLCTRSV
jgi:hypothetical protein